MNRGKVFKKKKKINRGTGVNVAERTEFARKCIAYGLSPDFYEEGCLYDNMEFAWLVGFDHENCILRKESGELDLVPFRKTIDMMQEHFLQSISELNAKLGLMLLEPSDPGAIAIKREVRSDLRNKIECADRALDVYNGHMDSVLFQMNMPQDTLGTGLIYRNSLYEFVSYRGGNYVVEDICIPATESRRFKFVTFDTLKEGMLAYAKAEGDERVKEIAENMVPVQAASIVSVDFASVTLSSDNDGQMTMFA